MKFRKKPNERDELAAKVSRVEALLDSCVGLRQYLGEWRRDVTLDDMIDDLSQALGVEVPPPPWAKCSQCTFPLACSPGAGDGMCGTCRHDARRSGWNPADA